MGVNGSVVTVSRWLWSLDSDNKNKERWPKEIKQKMRDGLYMEEKQEGNIPAWKTFVIMVDNDGLYISR